jgi:hypothetical protein
MENSDLLSWSTSSENNNQYFEVQHSTNGMDFQTIAKVNSKAVNGNSQTALNYKAVHENPVPGHNYYRLTQVDIDGKINVHAKVLDIIWGNNGSTVSIYPNPAKDVLNIDLFATRTQNTSIKLMDMSGRLVKQIQLRSEAGMNQVKVDLRELAEGIYTVQVIANDELISVSKVHKN